MKQSLPSDRLNNRLSNRPEGMSSDEDDFEVDHKGLSSELKIVIYVAIGAVVLLFLSMFFWDDIMRLSKNSRHNVPNQEQVTQPVEVQKQDSVSNIKSNTIKETESNDENVIENKTTNDKVDDNNEPHSQINEHTESAEELSTEHSNEQMKE